MKMKLFGFLLCSLCSLVQLRANVIFSGSNGSGLSASANFQLNGDQLIVTLTNTSSTQVTSANQILTALFFDVKGSPAMTGSSAAVASGSSVLYGDVNNDCKVTPTSKCNGPNVSGEWAFADGLSGAPFGLTYGVSSSSYGGLFSSSELMSSTSLQKNAPLSGVEYGLDSAGGSSSSGSAAVTGQYALIKNSVTITLDVPADCNFQLSDITEVGFQYGSSLSSSDFEVLPEPTTYAGPMLLALLPIAWLGVRRRKRASVV